MGSPDNGALSIFIDESGVGQLTVNYTLDWTATADYGCIKRWRQPPPCHQQGDHLGRSGHDLLGITH